MTNKQYECETAILKAQIKELKAKAFDMKEEKKLYDKDGGTA